MKRLFWAIGIEEELAVRSEGQLDKIKIAAKRRGLDVRWSPRENYHVTLCFLGDVEEEKIDLMLPKVESVAGGFAPFELKLKGVSAFPELARGRAVYVGVQAKKELMDLQAKMRDALMEFFELEEREYRPHMTIGRLRNKSNLSDVLSPLAKKDFGKAHVKELILFESSLAGAFPVYTAIFKAALSKTLTST